VHHRQPVLEYMHAGKRAAVHDWRAADAFKEGQPQEHDDFRREGESVSHELVGELERRVGDDGPDVGRRAVLHQEVNAMLGVGAAVVHQIRGINLVSSAPQDAHNRAGAAGGLPDNLGQVFRTQERPRGKGGRLVQVVTPHGEGGLGIPGVQSCGHSDFVLDR
jgi:hypothetical protein